MNDLKNIDKFEMIGELLLDLSSQASDGDLVVIRSDDERLRDIGISEVENIVKIIGEESGSYDGYERYESGYDGVVSFTKFSLMVNSLELRDYLIDLYGVKDSKSIPELQQEYEDSKILYWIDFDKNGFIILNDKYKLAQMEYGSNSYEIFSYLFKNQNKEVSKEEIEVKKKIKISRDLPKTLFEIGFKKEIRKLFVKSSKKKVIFRKKVTLGQMKQSKVNQVLLQNQISDLEIYKN